MWGPFPPWLPRGVPGFSGHKLCMPEVNKPQLSMWFSSLVSLIKRKLKRTKNRQGCGFQSVTAKARGGNGNLPLPSTSKMARCVENAFHASLSLEWQFVKGWILFINCGFSLYLNVSTLLWLTLFGMKAHLNYCRLNNAILCWRGENKGSIVTRWNGFGRNPRWQRSKSREWVGEMYGHVRQRGQNGAGRMARCLPASRAYWANVGRVVLFVLLKTHGGRWDNSECGF